MRHLVVTLFILMLACGRPAYYNGETGFQYDSDKMIGDQLYRALDKLTNQMVASMESEQKKSVAVIEFSHLNGTISGFGRFLAEKLISKLFETQRFKVIERSLLNKVIEEYKLSQSGVTAPEMAEQLGKLLGVDAIISGTITDMGGGFDVNARIIDTRSGGLLAAASVVVAKDEMVRRLLEMEDLQPIREPTTMPAPAPEYTPLPAGTFTSAIEVDTRVLIKLEPVYELARKKHEIKLANNRLVWQNLTERNLIAFIHSSGKIIILSADPLSSQADMEAFRSAYVTISNYIIRVNVDLNKSVRNRAWERDLTVYNYERNTYKRLMGYLQGEAIISVPRMNMKQVSLFVYADGWNNRIFIDDEQIARWSGKGSKSMDVTRHLIVGDHSLNIKQYGGTRPFFVLEFFVESTPLNVRISNEKNLNLSDSIPCYSISELRLPQ